MPLLSFLDNFYKMHQKGVDTFEVEHKKKKNKNKNKKQKTIIG